MQDLQLEQLFSDREKEQISSFINNEDMFKAVKKVVLSSIYFDGTIRKEGIPSPLTNFALNLVAQATNDMKVSNAKLGRIMKESLAAVQLLEQGFAKLWRFDKKKPKKEDNKPNPGR